MKVEVRGLLTLVCGSLVCGSGGSHVQGAAGHVDLALVLGLVELGGEAGDLTVVPLGTVVQTCLTVDLVVLGRTGLGQRLQEEVALFGAALHGQW